MAEIAMGDSGGSARHPEIDWEAAERSPEFQKLISKRRSFVIPVLGFVFIWYFGFIALAGYAPGFMGESIYEGFTVGYAIALSQFVMTWFLGWLYLRKADRDFDPLAKRAAERALGAAEAADERELVEAPEVAVPSRQVRARRPSAPRSGREVTGR